MQDGLLDVHAIFGLVQDDGGRRVQDLVGDFRATVGREAVHEDRARGRVIHEFAIDLKLLEGGAANFFLGFKAHAGPGIGVNGLDGVDRFERIGKEFDARAGILGDALAIGNDIGSRGIICGSGDAQMDAEASGEIDKRVADVVAIADVSQFETADGAEFFFKREEVGERLTGMETV